MAPFAILDFSNKQIFIFRTVCGDDLRVVAKLRRDRLNDCKIIASSRFPMWRLSATLDF